MSAKIPQDVTREDRLVGPLTLRQFLYLLAGGALTFLAYQYYAQGYLFLIEFLIISFVVDSLVVALAFAKINGLPFGQFMSKAFQFFLSPKLRTWEKDETEQRIVDTSEASLQGPTVTPNKKAAPESQLEMLAKVLDTGGKINEATAVNHKVGSLGENTTSVSEPEVEDILSEVDES